MYTEKVVLDILDTELSLFPEADIIDVYKLFYQAHYGPNHIAVDEQLFNKYLLQELTQIIDNGKLLYQDIGAGKGYYRVYLSIFSKIPVLDLEKYTRLFSSIVFASRKPEQIYHAQWIEKWKVIYNLIVDSAAVKSRYTNLLKGTQAGSELGLNPYSQALPHHSARYTALYKPHYRLVSAQQMDTVVSLFNL